MCKSGATQRTLGEAAAEGRAKSARGIASSSEGKPAGSSESRAKPNTAGTWESVNNSLLLSGTQQGGVYIRGIAV